MRNICTRTHLNLEKESVVGMENYAWVNCRTFWLKKGLETMKEEKISVVSC
jgi:hypothetical protein